MPGFSQIVASMKQQEEEKKGTQSEQNSPDYQTQEPSNDGSQQQPPTEPKKLYGSKEEKTADIGSRVQAQNDPIGARQQYEPEAGQGAVGADVSGRDWASEAGTSFMRGLGSQVIGGFGDIAQVLGAGIPGVDMFEGNIISRFLQEKGDNIAKSNEVYMPEELKNPEFSLKTLTNPAFWSKHGAEYIPQLAEFIFLSKGMGALAKKGVQAGAKQAVKRGLITDTVGTLKTSKKLASGVDEVYEVTKGKGLGSFITDTGALTQTAGLAVENIGAGMAGNVVTGLLNSAEAYNSRKEVVDANGNPVFNQDELSSIAAETFKNNLMYMGVDILSWGMTYGGGAKLLKQTNLFKSGKAAFDSTKNLKNISSSFTAKTAPALRKIATMAGKGMSEGFEETFQETYETWASMMAESDVMGTEPKYDSFMDFYNSEENEGTKTISFAMGMLGGGVAGLFTNVNKDAERSRQLYNRTENLKTIFDKADAKGNEWKQFHARETISDMILQDKKDLFKGFAEAQIAEGVLTEEEVAKMAETLDDYEALDKQSDLLNVRGKYALFKNHSTEKFFLEQIANKEAELKEAIEVVNASSITDQQKKAEIEKRTIAMDKVIRGLAYGVAQSQANKGNLILGKPVEKVVEPVFITDKYGQTIVQAGLSKADYKYYVEKKNEDILKPNNRAEIAKDNAEYDGTNVGSSVMGSLSSIGAKARSLFSNLMGSKTNEENDQTDTSSTEAQESNSEQQTESQSEDGESVPPKTPTGTGSDGTSQNDDNDTSTVQGEENGDNETEDSETGPIEEVGDNISNEELEEMADLQEELDSLKKPKKNEKPKEKTQREQDIEAVKKRLGELGKKAKSKVKESLPKGLNKENFDKIVSKLSGKTPLNKKEQEIVDNFQDTFDSAVKKATNIGRNFQNFVNKQIDKGAKKAREATEATKTSKIKKNLQDSIKAYRKGSGPFGMEARTDEEQEAENSRDDDNNFEEYVDDNSPINENQVEAPIIGRIKYMPSDLDKMVAINQRLNFMFPKANNTVNAYILDDLTKALGIQGAGYAISSAIFVKSDKWDQGEVFMHEMSHVFYKFAKDRPETQDILQIAMQNKKLIDHLMRPSTEGGYSDYVLYSFGYDSNGNREIGTFSGVPTQATLDEYGATMLPLAEQKYILEEAFVHTMQGPLSKKYNNFFGLRDEAKRITTTRKWWKMVDTKAKSDPAYLQETKELMKKLNGNEELDVNNMRDYIVMEFLKEVPRLESQELGFESRITAVDAKAMKRKVVIKVRLEKETASYNAKESQKIFNKKEELLDQVLDEVSDNMEDSDVALSMAEKSFDVKSKKATRILNAFIKEYNRAIRLRKSIWGRQGPLFDKKDFKYKMFQLANQTENAVDFIDAIENSPQPDVQAFNKFLELRAPSAKTVFLNSSWLLWSNAQTVSALKTIISENPDGSIKHSIEEALSKREQTNVQTMLDNMSVARGHLQKRNGHLLGDQWENFEAIVSRIETNEATEQDYIDAYKFMAPPGIKILDILEHGFINVKGTYYNPVTVLKNFIDNKKHLGEPNKNGIRYMNEYNFRPLAQALVATNREFTQDSVVENAKGNMVPVRIMNNHMTKEMNQMYKSLQPNRDGKVMSKADFIKRYSHITSSKSYRKPVPNQFLENYYDSVIAGNKPDIVYYTGINDTVTSQANEFKDSTAYEQSFEDFMQYAASPNKKTYLANVGVFGDSPRKYYMPTKRLNMSNDINEAAYNIYRNISEDGISRRQFELGLKAEMRIERAFFENNGTELMKIDSLKNLFDSKGKLNKEGIKMVNGYVYNQTINGLFMAEVMSPNIKIDNIAKRLKNAGSPVITVNKNLKFEPVFFKDPSGDEASTDGGMFILREDADRWANAGKGVFDLNEGFKFLNYSVEKDNPNFKGQTVLLKGYTTILDEDFIKDNPKFKGLYDLMKARRAKYFEAHKKQYGSEPTMNFSDGLENSFPIAIPFSAEKTGMQKSEALQGVVSLNELAEGKFDDKGNLVEGTEEALMDALEAQDKLMYDKKGKFLGLSGYNFGPQQVMDITVDEVTLPVQQMNSLLVHALALGNLDEAEAIQGLISEMMNENLDSLIRDLKGKDIETYRKVITDKMAKEDMDQVQRFVIERYGILHPRAIEIVSNQLANTIKNEGNKLKVPGTFAQQKSSYGWQMPVDGQIKGGKDLNGYTEAASGLNRAEMIAPKHLEGKVRPRRYYTLDSEPGKMAMKINDNKGYFDSSKTPAENDLIRLKNAADKTASVYGMKAEQVLKDGKVIGYYVPGETVIATRVPSNGPNFTGIFEVVGFTTGEGNQVQVPTSFTQIIGADFDGDVLFIQHKSKNKKMNEVIDRMEKLWLSDKMAPFIQTSMNTKQAGDRLKAHIEKQGLKAEGDRPLAFSPNDRRKSYEDSMVAKRNIGTVFNLHRMANTLAAYRATMKNGILIDNQNYQIFEDLGVGDDSRNHKSALVANLILDNLKENAADALNLNEHTVAAFTLLVNLNVPVEDVASLMNAPMVKEYVNIMNENNSAYHGYTPKGSILKNLANKPVKGKNGTVKYDSKSKGGVISDAKNPEFFSQSNQSNIINMIMEMDKVNTDLQKVSKIVGGHNGIETNPYLLEQQISEFNRIMNNDGTALNIPFEMTKNPDLARYLKTAEATLEHTKEIDLVYRPAMTKFLQGLATKQGMDLLTDNQIKKYTKSIMRFLHSNISEFNTISKEELAVIVDPKNPEGVFQSLSEYMAQEKMNGTLEGNTLLTQGMNMKFEGRNPYISMNPNFFDESLSPQEVKKMNREFAALPSDLQHKLFHYDLAKNGWDSPMSLLPMTDSYVNDFIVRELNSDFSNKNDKKYSTSDLRELEEVLMLRDFNGVRNNIPTFNLKGSRIDIIKSMQKDPKFKKALENNTPFYFKSRNNKGRQELYRFVGNKADVFSKPIDNSLNRLLHLAENASRMIKKIPTRTNAQLEIDLVTISNSDSRNPVTPLLKKKGEPIGMEAREDFWSYDSTEYMSRNKFDDTMEFNKFQTEASKQEAYEIYIKEKEKANATYDKNFRGKDLNSFSPEKLMQIYTQYGAKNAYAYAVITTPVVKALAAKISAQQSKLTGRTKGNTDLNTIQTWLMSNNIPSDHPEIQGMVRNMLAMEKDFQNEKKKYTSKINEVTNALYKDKFDFVFDTYNPVELLKRFYYSYIHNRQDLYTILYGNIVEENEIVSEGKKIREFKLKDVKEINRLKEAGQLSEAEYNFYKTFRDVTEELAPFSTSGGKKKRRDYIPHVGMGTFESFANKGLLGLLQLSKDDNESLGEVMLYNVDPTTQEKRLVKFKDIDNIYSAMAANSKNNPKQIKEYYDLKSKAKRLLKSGKNEDGTDIQISTLEMDSALSFGVMNRFTNSRSIKASEMPSMDLNHALNTYVHATLFVNGNSKFDGFKSMQGVVDGILALNQDKGFKNAGKYVKLNWKDYFLKGKRQELLGKKADKAVDLITKLNLFWQLGFKASYVLGNIAQGKYHNIKNGSPKEWAQGEKRFWGLDAEVKDPFEIVKRFKRTQKILKTLNFMDINVYDNVSMSSKGRLDNFLGDLALMPMTWSERWIQGVQMAGMLTEEEWNKFDENGEYKPMEEPIKNSRLTMLEDEVKKSQGRGYQATDQRLVQQYSLGRMMLQFSRFIPTMVNDRFAKQDIDIYGNEHIGSLRMVFKTVSEVQSMNPKDYIEYRKKLQKDHPELARRLDSGLKGLAMSGLIGAYAIETNNKFADDTYWDTNYYANLDKLEYKAVPSAIRTTKSLIESLFGGGNVGSAESGGMQ